MTTARQLAPPAAADLDRDPAERIDIPDRLTSPQTKLVYLYLHVRGTATVDEVGTALDLPKLSLFSILGTLGDYDLVVRDGESVTLT